MGKHLIQLPRPSAWPFLDFRPLPGRPPRAGHGDTAQSGVPGANTPTCVAPAAGLLPFTSYWNSKMEGQMLYMLQWSGTLVL
jgi:hypothetical protein